MVRYAKLLLPFDINAMQAELLSSSQQWQPHLNSYHYTGSWTVLPVRSPGGTHTNPVPELMGKHTEYLDTEYMGHFPSVKRLLSSLNCPVLSARFLNLQAGAVIKQHRDAELALEKGEARLHFVVITNPGVEFYSEDERIFLNEGECWYLNANLPHRVSNLGNADRVHLVVDCKVNDWLKGIVNESDKIAHKEELPDYELTGVIMQLRLQNTETANKLADNLQQKLDEINNNLALHYKA
jgi:quercetin dioxygenase-like cupin family protein